MRLDLWGWKPFKFSHKPAEGRLGGILVAWNSRIIEVLDVCTRDYSVSVICKNKEVDKLWVFSSIYGPCNMEGLRKMWEELNRLMAE